jgi:hypothetical protein
MIALKNTPNPSINNVIKKGSADTINENPPPVLSTLSKYF